MCSDQITSTMTLDTIVAIWYSRRVRVIQVPLSCCCQRSNLLTSRLVTWREKHLWNFSVFQRVHLYNLVILSYHLRLNMRSDHERSASIVRTLMMEVVRSSETSVNIYPTTRRNIPEDGHLHTLCSENLESYLASCFPTKFKMRVSSPSWVLHVLPISLSFYYHNGPNLAKCTKCVAPHNAVFSTSLLLPVSLDQHVLLRIPFLNSLSMFSQGTRSNFTPTCNNVKNL
jgi:hypothetical protein